VEGIRPMVPRLGGARGAGSDVRDGRRETGDGGALAVGERPAPARHPGVEPVPLAERSRWGKKIATGQFVTSVEIVPPRGVDASRMLEDVRALQAAGIDAVNVPDGPRAQS